MGIEGIDNITDEGGNYAKAGIEGFDQPEDEEQARRRAAREDSERGREAHNTASNVDGKLNTYDDPDVPHNAS